MKIYGKIITDKDEWKNYMEEFHPRVSFAPGCAYYALGDRLLDGQLSRREIAGCSGMANKLLGRSYYKIKDTMSWGYEGDGSDLLAGWLITNALYYADTMNVMWEDCEAFKQSYRLCVAQERMLKHYKAFSEEVVAKLPDEWALDLEWIRKWVVKRERKLSKEAK